MLPDPIPGVMGDVRISICDLDAPSAADVRVCLKDLSTIEAERAARFRFPRHAARFIVCRSALRRVLGGLLGIGAAEVPIRYGAFGKPELDVSPHAAPRLGFNVSHCEGYALIATAVGMDIGVDVEDIEREVELDEVAQLAFAVAERDRMKCLQGTAKRRYFFRCWTLREAFLKCLGTGLIDDPSCFSVSPGESCGARLALGTLPVGGTFEVRELALSGSNVASISTSGAIQEVRTEDFDWKRRDAWAGRTHSIIRTVAAQSCGFGASVTATCLP